ncbi:SGNH hydrolase-type esterase domain-containing protein [Sporodiniella umbellata]|nr:SGNH hydrolase-type esterase domain-containing protein [Sporodiniella umbellata]
MSLVIFGDSYSDSTPSRRTNGPVWSEVIAEGWHVPLVSFAKFGATLCPNGKGDRSWLAQQVQASLAVQGQTYMILMGITDIVEASKARSGEWIECIQSQVDLLFHQNPDAQVLILGLPALDFAPFAKHHETLKDRLVSFNVALEEAVEEWKTKNDRLAFYNTYGMFSDFLGDPSGIENVEQAYWDVCQGQCQESMDRYLWWDALHLTGAGHRALAQDILDQHFFNHTLTSNPVPEHAPRTPSLSWALLAFFFLGALLLLVRHSRLLPYLKTKIQTVTRKNKDYTRV